jgi:acyl-coenzyme A synthetase/AMP-(fatty) acid ligase
MPEQLYWQPSAFETPDPQLTSEPLPIALDRAVQLWPTRPAVVSGERTFTYQDLAQRVAGLADEIRQSTAAPGPVALIQSPGLDAVAAWFACAMARRPFLLLEPTHPSLRLRELIGAASATLILCDRGTCERVPRDTRAKWLQSDGLILPWTLRDTLETDEPAMVFPTSGSTGMPKLVTYSSRTLQVKVQSSRTLMRIPPEARVLIAGSHGNFGFLHHALVFLLSGGTLCLADLHSGGFSAILRAITELGASHVRFTPSLFRALAAQPEAGAALRSLQAVRFSGEPLLKSDLDLARSLLDPSCFIQNVYGSTESSLFIWSLGDEMEQSAGTVPIGRVYPHTAYALRPLPDAQDDHNTGELLLRSAFHALGDLRAGVIDATRFPVDPQASAERTYATGDIVRRLPGGGLVMLGRSTRMVKVRGQRVFLTEIENHLRAIPGVTGAAAVDRNDGDDTIIYAFITRADGEEPQAQARAWLAHRLPEFMVPRQVLVVDTIPTLPGGKVDYTALLGQLGEIPTRPVSTSDNESNYARLSDLWRNLLGWGAHDPRNDFFALGGDSLKEMQLTLAVEREFGRSMPTEAFRANPTLHGLAVALGIAPPEDARPAKLNNLALRLFSSTRKTSRGIALAMPGWHGSAIAAPFKEAGLFPDHEIWSADVPLASGNLTEKNRWWKAAIEIATELKEARMPAPQILFGYSVGGSIAWLVGRLLAGTPQCPSLVIRIDAAPLHRLSGFRNREIVQLVRSTVQSDLPAALHVRRAPLDDCGITFGSMRRWQPEDNVVDNLDLPTVDHLEMCRPDVLRVAAPFIMRALETPSLGMPAKLPGVILQTPGGRLHRMLGNAEPGETSDLDLLIEDPRSYMRLGCVGALVHLMLRDGCLDQQRRLLDLALTEYPGMRLLQYARRRVERRPEMLCTDSAAVVNVPSLGGIEKALAARSEVPLRWIGLRRFFQAVDIIGALASAGPARMRNAINRWSGV